MLPLSRALLPLLLLQYFTTSDTGVVDSISRKTAATDMTLPSIYTKISVVSHSHVAQLGEGPYWDEKNSKLYYVDAVASSFHRLDPVTGNSTAVTLPSGLVSIIIPYAGKPGDFIVSNVNHLLKLNWDDGKTEQIATVSPELNGLERFNDAKCDPKGRIFIGTVLESSPGGAPVPLGGSLYKLEGSTFVKQATGFTITNGMAWSNDPKAKDFYLNDSEGRKIYVFDYDLEQGILSNKRILIDCDNHPDFVANEYPDGMAMDSFGFIWVAMWNGRRVVRINPVTARVVDSVVFPRVKIPSSVAFDPYQGHFGLYVTTAATGIPYGELEDEGKIHHIAIEGGEIRGFKP